MYPKMWFPFDNFSTVRRILMKFGKKVHGMKINLSSIFEYVIAH